MAGGIQSDGKNGHDDDDDTHTHTCTYIHHHHHHLHHNHHHHNCLHPHQNVAQDVLAGSVTPLEDGGDMSQWKIEVSKLLTG